VEEIKSSLFFSLVKRKGVKGGRWEETHTHTHINSDLLTCTHFSIQTLSSLKDTVIAYGMWKWKNSKKKCERQQGLRLVKYTDISILSPSYCL
jgi:hypothetical protein